MITDDLPRALDQLASFGQSPDVAIRPVLLRVMVDLFSNKPHHSDVGIRQFEEILSHILDDADEETRLAVAEKLSRHPQTPRSLLERLIADRGAAAAAVVGHAAVGVETLAAAAVLGTTEMAMAAAERDDLDAATVRSLAERPESEVLHALADNPSAPIDAELLRYLARRARSDGALAAKLLRRPGAEASSAALFFSASRSQRATLIAEARRRDLGTVSRSVPITVSTHALAAIERASWRRGVEELDVGLATLLGLSRADIDQIMDDDGGEPLALTLAAVGVSPETAARIFILGDPAIGRSFERVQALLTIVADVSPRAAFRLVMSMLGRSTEILRRSSVPAQPEGQPRRSFGAVTVRTEPSGVDTGLLRPARRRG